MPSIQPATRVWRVPRLLTVQVAVTVSPELGLGLSTRMLSIWRSGSRYSMRSAPCPRLLSRRAPSNAEVA